MFHHLLPGRHEDACKVRPSGLSIRRDYETEQASWYLLTRQVCAIPLFVKAPGQRMAPLLERLLLWHGAPKQTTLDNGPELTGQALAVWAYQRRTPRFHRARQTHPEREPAQLQRQVPRRMLDRLSVWQPG